jgi:hypothetical protein
MMTPSPGTKLFAGTFADGLVLARVGGRESGRTCTTGTT